MVIFLEGNLNNDKTSLAARF